MTECWRAAALLLFLVATPALAQESACQIDDQIAPSARGEIEAAALKAADTLLGDNPAAAFPLMTRATQATASADVLATQVRAYTLTGAPFSNIRVGHSYFLPGAGTETRLNCGAGENAVRVSVKPGTLQAHVLVEADGRNNGWAVTEWLMPEDGAWRVYYFDIGVTSIAGHDPRALLALARTERDSGHPFNATLLYAGLKATATRGPNFQTAITPEVTLFLGTYAVPPEFLSRPPFDWTLAGKHYRLTGASILGIGTQMGIVFDLPQTDWPDQAHVDARNRAFLDAFRVAHPDYARVFGFLLARAHKPDNSGGYSTVYENSKGYDN